MSKIAQEKWAPLLTRLSDIAREFGDASTEGPIDPGIAAMHGTLASLLAVAATHVGPMPQGWSTHLDYEAPTRENQRHVYLSVTIVPKAPTERGA